MTGDTPAAAPSVPGDATEHAPTAGHPPPLTDPATGPASATHRASLERLFAGHSPDFPVLPGVCVLDYAYTSAEAHQPVAGLRLRAVDRVRFTGVASPGDELTVELEWTPLAEDEWSCVAVVSTPQGKASYAHLRYVREGDR